MLQLLFSIILSLTLGYLLICCLFRTSSPNTFERLLKFSLGTGLGLGLSSCIYFIGILIFTPSGNGLRIFDISLHVVMIIGLFMTCHFLPERPNSKIPSADPPAKPILYYLFWASLIVSVLTLGLMALQSPYGGQDALCIWNLRARVLLKSQGAWLHDLATIGAHPDYPLLLPSLIARSWSYFGRSAWWIPFLIQWLIMYAAILVLAALIGNLRGDRMGLIAGWVLLGTPFFLRESVGLQADTMVAYYILSALALICLKEWDDPNRFGWEAAAGLMAALAAWTKNEGILFLVVLLSSRALLLCRRSGPKAALRSLAGLAVGMLPVMVLLVYFKIYIAPGNDLISGQSVPATLARLSDLSRYAQILAAFLNGMLAPDRWQVYPILLVIYVRLAGITTSPANRAAGLSILTVVLTMLCGYFCVYLTTPHDLHWHLRTALHRLLLQLWPATLLMVFLLVRKQSEL